MENIIEMGFEQDITAVHEQLKMLFQEKNSGIHNRKSIISIDLRVARVRDCGGIFIFFFKKIKIKPKARPQSCRYVNGKWRFCPLGLRPNSVSRFGNYNSASDFCHFIKKQYISAVKIVLKKQY